MGRIQRIDAHKLISLILDPIVKQEIRFILSENQIFKKLSIESLSCTANEQIRIFETKSAIVDYVDYIATGGLFTSNQYAVVVLPDKLTSKQWVEEKKYLERLTLPIEFSGYFFANTQFRNLLKEEDLSKHATIFLCYEPQDTELLKCINLLLNRYKSLSLLSDHEKQQIIYAAFETYAGDLISCDMHFERMQKAQLNFQQALAGQPEINAFHVADALSRGERYLIELRIDQCASCGEDVSNIFMTIIYFLKQVLFTIAALEEVNNLKIAFERAKIHFPMQARVQRSLKILTTEKILAFFAQAADIEYELRIQKNPHKYLALFLGNICNTSITAGNR